MKIWNEIAANSGNEYQPATLAKHICTTCNAELMAGREWGASSVYDNNKMSAVDHGKQ